MYILDSLEGDQLVASKIEETVSRETGGNYFFIVYTKFLRKMYPLLCLCNFKSKRKKTVI